MSTSIPKHILGINAQVVNTIQQQESGKLIIVCSRDKRTKIIDPTTKLKTTVNRFIRQTVKDLPLLGRPCLVEIELAQVNTHDGYRIVEDCAFVDINPARKYHSSIVYRLESSNILLDS